jgi:hypothetical protein
MMPFEWKKLRKFTFSFVGGIQGRVLSFLFNSFSLPVYPSIYGQASMATICQNSAALTFSFVGGIQGGVLSFLFNSFSLSVYPSIYGQESMAIISRNFTVLTLGLQQELLSLSNIDIPVTNVSS